MSNIIDFTQVAKAEPESGWPSFDARPLFKTHDEPVHDGVKMRNPGLYWHSIRMLKDGITAVQTDIFICPPLHIEAGSRDKSDHNYGLLIKFLNRDGRWAKWLMPCEMVGGNSEDINRHLQHRGLPVDNMAMLKKFFNQARPGKRLECALKTGWHDANNFVLPDKVIGSREDDVFFQADHDAIAEYGTKNTLEVWRNGIGRLCVGNPLLLFQMSVSFTGPLLKKAGIDYVGGNIVGETSAGKSTGQKAAVSVWGSQSFGNTWNSTGNGLEALAAMYNDGLLALDELGNSRARDVDNIIYMVANGKGKSRAKIKGTPRKAQAWRVALLSNGEVTLEQHLKSEGITVKGGQSARFLEIPVFGKHGALNELHGFENGAAFSVEIQKRVEMYYGTAGLAYLEQLSSDDRDFHRLLNEIAEQLSFDGMCNQEGRAVRMFAVIAMAGELATEYGITGWSKGDAIQGIKECMKHWRNNKGVGNTTDNAILEAVRSYVDKYGDLRFTKRNPGSMHDKTVPTGERSGWFEYRDDSKVWLFSSTGLREATKGYDFGQATKALINAGWLIAGKDGKTSTVNRIEGVLERVHVIQITG